PLATRAVGTAQAPVISSSNIVVVTGVAGATFSSVAENTQKTGGGSPIVVWSDKSSGNDEIYLIPDTFAPYGNNSSPSIPKNLTSNPANDNDAAVSPDGSKIAFASNRDGNQEIYVMNIDGTNVTRLTNNPAVDGQPSWSPDGTKIAFTSNRTGNYDIFVMN